MGVVPVHGDDGVEEYLEVGACGIGRVVLCHTMATALRKESRI